MYKNVGRNYEDRILNTIANEVVKATLAKYVADYLLKQRENVSIEIRQTLKSRARDFHIDLKDVAITHLSFSKAFMKAIEYKQVA